MGEQASYGDFDADRLSDWASMLDADQLALAVEVFSAALVDAASAEGDLEAVVERAFETGFDHKGVPNDPWVHGDVLVVCGSVRGSVRGSHKCTFATVGDSWVWQHPTVVSDTVRHLDNGVRTVTLLPAVPGTIVEVVSSAARSGNHRRTDAVVWKYTTSGFEVVERKGAGPGRSHR